MEAARAKRESDLALLKTQSETFQTLLPEPKTAPLEGAISVYGEGDKLGYAAEIVAYRTLAELKVAVAERVCEDGVLAVEEDAAAGAQAPAEGKNVDKVQDAQRQRNPSVLVVGGDPEAYAHGNLALVEVEAQFTAYGAALAERSDRNTTLLQAYLGEPTKEEERGVQAAFADPATLALLLAATPRATGAIADVASYFLADYGVKEREFDLNRRGLVAAVAGRLHARGVDVRVPGFLAVDESPLLTRLSVLQKTAIELRASKDSLSALATGSLGEEVAQFKKWLENAEKDGEPAPVAAGQHDTQRTIKRETPDRDELERKLVTSQRRLDEAKAAVSSTETILAAFDGFCGAITAPGEGQAPSKLARAVVREKLRTAEVTHLLWLDVLSSGGEAVTKRTRWPWSSGEVSLMGGAAIAFVLATTAGKVVAADTLARVGVLERPLFGGKRGTQVSI